MTNWRQKALLPQFYKWPTEEVNIRNDLKKRFEEAFWSIEYVSLRNLLYMSSWTQTLRALSNNDVRFILTLEMSWIYVCSQCLRIEALSRLWCLYGSSLGDRRAHVFTGVKRAHCTDLPAAAELTCLSDSRPTASRNDWWAEGEVKVRVY